MIWYYVILFINNVFVAVFYAIGLGPVDTLPTILGYDIDAALSGGVAMVHSLSGLFWPIWYMFLGALSVLGYHVLKMVLRMFLGHRAPGA